MPDTSNHETFRIVTINDDEEVRVSPEAKELFELYDPRPVNEMAFKCSGCQVVAVHQGFTLAAVNVHDAQKVDRRIVMCRNCGKISTK